MTYPILIEIAGEDAGIVAPLRRGYTFYAASRRFHALDGKIFRTPWHAEKAARRLFAHPSPERQASPPSVSA